MPSRQRKRNLSKDNSVLRKIFEQIVSDETAVAPQEEYPLLFPYQTPTQNDLANRPKNDIKFWYNQIRMLDSLGYFNVFHEVTRMRIWERHAFQRCNVLNVDARCLGIPSPPRQLLTGISNEHWPIPNCCKDQEGCS